MWSVPSNCRAKLFAESAWICSLLSSTIPSGSHWLLAFSPHGDYTYNHGWPLLRWQCLPFRWWAARWCCGISGFLKERKMGKKFFSESRQNTLYPTATSSSTRRNCPPIPAYLYAKDWTTKFTRTQSTRICRHWNAFHRWMRRKEAQKADGFPAAKETTVAHLPIPWTVEKATDRHPKGYLNCFKISNFKYFQVPFIGQWSQWWRHWSRKRRVRTIVCQCLILIHSTSYVILFITPKICHKPPISLPNFEL